MTSCLLVLPPPRRRYQAQSGIALLTVLFILVLMTTLVVYLIEDEYLLIRRVENQRDSEQIYQLMIGNEQWAIKVLERDLRENKIDHLNEIWNNLLPETQIEEGKMTASVIDLQGRFNLNNLTRKDDQWYFMFQRLLQTLEIDEGLADAIVDWIDQDIDVSGNHGAEDPEYLLQEPPYRSANRNFQTVGELVWVSGFNEENLEKLVPFVTALPGNNIPLNVNTAPIEVLQILSEEILSEASAETLIGGRGESGYQDIDEFLSSVELAAQSEKITPLISVSSRFFEIITVAEYGRLTGVLYSMVEKKPSTQQVRVVHRRRGFS